MKKFLISVMLLIAVPFVILPGGQEIPPAAAADVKIKNVILLIPDGMSPQAASLARLYAGKTLAIDKYLCGMVRTYSANGPITDSAAAASAMATGYKTNAGFISCLPEKGGMPGVVIDKSAKKAPVATILEAAKLSGKATGIVATAYVQDATPACFAGHYPDRNELEILAEQMVYIGPDVVLGGGASFLTNRRDKEDLTAAIQKAGYDYVIWPGRMRSSSSPKLWGMFAPKDLKYEFDRNKDAEPSLAEMTQKAIETLSKDPDGFFLMVEGSKIDWAAHANDPAGVISDVLSFDEAAGIVFDFAEKNMETIVIAAADHGTGGISIGRRDSAYEKLGAEAITAPLKKALRTGEGLYKLLYKDKSNLKQVMKDYFGIIKMNAWEEASLEVAPADKFNYAAGPILSARANIGWATNGHTGDDVALYCFDPRGKKLQGLIENTRIASYMEEALGLDLSAVTAELFVPVSGLAKEGFVAEPSFTDPENPELILSKNGKTAGFPANKNIIFDGKKNSSFIGLTVYNGKDWYIPSSAVKLAEEMLK